MDKFPKFIIEDDCLKIGKVTYHKDLATDPKKVKGGGLFMFHEKSNTFLLSGSSFDFGTAKLDDIKSCVENKKVFYFHRNISDQHNFDYYTGSEVIEIKKLEPEDTTKHLCNKHGELLDEGAPEDEI